MRDTTLNEDRLFGSAFLSDIIRWIGVEFVPEDVFDETDLEEWAKENGYVKENE
jgi:hypothetical protein